MFTNLFHIRKLRRLAYILSLAFLIAALVTGILPAQSGVAGTGAIWTTNEGCDNPAAQDDNAYAVGEWIHIRGENFTPGVDLSWSITGQPNSGDPKTVVASGTVTTDTAGYFCVTAYQVAPGDWGEYKVDAGDKNDNYRVEGVAPVYSMMLVKSASPQTYDSAGDIITYDYLITNTGNSPLTNVVVTDNKIPGLTCSAAILAAGSQLTCSASYTITGDDMTNGSVTNTATADSVETDPITDSETVTVIRSYILSLTKNASPVTYDAIGDTISYTYLVTNTGNSTLTGVSVTDNKAVVSCPSTTLAAGASMTCTASYSILDGDMTAGSVTNSATADSNETTPVTVLRTVNLVQNFGMTLVKTASPVDYDAVGDVINYTYVVTNTSNVAITSVGVTDNKAAVSCPATSLAAGASMTCTASYTIGEADMLAGSVTNIATANSAQVGPVNDTETVNLIRIYGLTVDKSATPVTYDAVNDVISYTYVVRNTGNVPLTGITVTDNKATVTCSYTTLAAGTSMTCTASYSITQEDLEAGSVTNTATADSNETGAVIDVETVRAVQYSQLGLAKIASPQTYAAAGAVIEYSYGLTNNGNIALTGITVTDDKAVVTCPSTTLAAGGIMTCTASYIITQADVDAGYVTNLATADSNQTDAVTDTETVRAIQAASITLVKTANPTSYAAAGAVIGYTYLVSNAGNLTLTSVSVTDDKATVTCPSTTLAVGASMTCTASYSVTQADLETGSVTNVASATSTQAGPVTDTETVTAVQSTGLTLEKIASPLEYDEVGDIIAYTYILTNTGNIALTNVLVTDDKTSVTCPSTTLAAGTSMTCTATYTITQADLDAGSVTNIAGATSDQTGRIRALAQVTTSPDAQQPELTLEKIAKQLEYRQPGDVLAYTYTVTNTGNVTITNIVVIDDKATVTCPETELAPGETMDCNAQYFVQAADMEAENVTNLAQAEGMFVEDPVLSNEATATVLRYLVLDLTSICSDTPTVSDGWRVDNLNPYQVEFEFSIIDGVVGTGLVPPNSYAIILTPVGSGMGVMNLYVGGLLEDSASAKQGCIPPDDGDPVDDDPPAALIGPVVLIPVTGRATGGETVLIPVTGVDMSARHGLLGTLFSLSIVFAGIGTVLGGVSRRREH